MSQSHSLLPPCRPGEPGPEGRVVKIMKRSGVGRIDLPEAGLGDIISVAGLEDAGVADTIASPEVEQALPAGAIDPPTLR